jgi:hypothetical protein
VYGNVCKYQVVALPTGILSSPRTFASLLVSITGVVVGISKYGKNYWGFRPPIIPV